MTLYIKGIECSCAGEAIQWADADGGEPISIGGKYLVVAKAEAERIAATGAFFAYVGALEEGPHAGQIVTIPVND